MRRLLPALLMAGLVAGCAAPGRDVVEELRLIGWVNDYRATRGLPALIPDDRLAAAARLQSLEMRRRAALLSDKRDAVGHWGNLLLRTQRSGYPCRRVRENVAGGNVSLHALHQALLDSPGHLANIVADDCVHVGVAIIPDDDWLFVTEVFARPLSAAQTPHHTPGEGTPRRVSGVAARTGL